MRWATSPASSIARPSSKLTITSKPVRGSCLPEDWAAVADGVVVPVPVEPEVGTLVPELVEGVDPVELPPPEPPPELELVLPELPLLSVVWPVLPPPPELASGAWYWSSPALWAKLVAGSASIARDMRIVRALLRSIRYL